MRNFIQLALLLLALGSVARAQEHTTTAREYFTELRDSRALDRYTDEYVCFHDDATVPSFIVISTVQNIVGRMSLAGNTEGVKALKKVPSSELSVETYYKGVSNGDPIFYDFVDGEYRLDFHAPFHGRMVYRINWTTGRYRAFVFDLDHSKTVPAYESAGRCELIHPSANK